jgi:mRNA-degrading endonuclease toxin of MazEF toxin-antitoxin module
VWWVERPEAGRRPHLTLTRDAAVPILATLLAVPATRTVLDNPRAIGKEYFVRPICTLGHERMADVCEALDHATGRR